jgi:hypothetical protein
MENRFDTFSWNLISYVCNSWLINLYSVWATEQSWANPGNVMMFAWRDVRCHGLHWNPHLLLRYRQNNPLLMVRRSQVIYSMMIAVSWDVWRRIIWLHNYQRLDGNFCLHLHGYLKAVAGDVVPNAFHLPILNGTFISSGGVSVHNRDISWIALEV